MPKRAIDFIAYQLPEPQPSTPSPASTLPASNDALVIQSQTQMPVVYTVDSPDILFAYDTDVSCKRFKLTSKCCVNEIVVLDSLQSEYHTSPDGKT